MDKKQGKLICFEGIDGSGKTTQIELLEQYLASQGWTLQIINFPRYGENLYADLVKRYLKGEFGGINEVDPYLVSLAYAGDRFLAKPQIDRWLASGKLVVANRYVSSSKAHLGANLAEEKRDKFFKWLDELEYKINVIPKEDLTILLIVDPKVSQQNARGEHEPDIHEQDLTHLEEASKIYLELSKLQPKWVVVDCMRNGQMRSKEDIHQEIMHILSTKLPT